MIKPLSVAVIFGGTNTEHEVSLVSARSIIQNLDPQKYQVLPVKISKDNQWLTTKKLVPATKAVQATKNSAQLIPTQPQQLVTRYHIKVVFPIIHGPYGEDGTLQGLLELMHVPYVGCGVLASALCMDKVVQKQLCQAHQIPIVDFIFTTNHLWQNSSVQIINDCQRQLGFPCFVKPANQGSSIGIVKATNRHTLKQAVNLALTLDTKVLIEATVQKAREIECSVLGHHEHQASVLGEIVPSNDFYDYDAKYIDGKSQAIIPAKLPKKITTRIQETALEAFKLLNCAGLARVDFLVEQGTGKFYLNELNTMPGFTTISMYPKLWQASGLSYPKLIDRLIQLALDRYQEKSNLNFSYAPKINWHEHT